jgi:hypothetical protein
LTTPIHGDHAFVVLAYKASPFLIGCLESLMTQSVPSQVLIATSTPCDHIRQAAARFQIPIRVNPKHEGIAADWNFALSQSDQRYVTLAHQDDVYYPKFAERTLSLFAEASAGAVAFTGYTEIDDGGEPKTSKISHVKHALEAVILGSQTLVYGLRLRAFLALGNPLPCSSATFDRAKLPDFAFSDAFSSNMDWDAWVRLGEAGTLFLHTGERLIGRRHNTLTETHRLIAAGQRGIEDLLMFRRLWPASLATAIASLYRLGY